MASKQRTPIHDENLVIRTAIARDAKTGYIAACSRAKEAREEPHTVGFKWQAGGTFIRGEAGFNIHTMCLIHKPELGVVQASAPGIFSLLRPAGTTTGNIFRDARCNDTRERFGDIRSVASIAGTGYAVGYGGVVYRLDKSGWVCVDAGLPDSFDIECMDGFDGDHRVAVGLKGQIWTWDGKAWKSRSSGTNAILTTVCCAANGVTYTAGQGGLLLAGGGDTWEEVEHDIDEKIWDLAWFDDALYASTHAGVFRLRHGAGLEKVDFGKDEPATTYQLSVAPGVLWSIGSRDILSFDGTRWSRVV